MNNTWGALSLASDGTKRVEMQNDKAGEQEREPQPDMRSAVRTEQEEADDQENMNVRHISFYSGSVTTKRESVCQAAAE